jgi:Surface antigen variable number repeat
MLREIAMVAALGGLWSAGVPCAVSGQTYSQGQVEPCAADDSAGPAKEQSSVMDVSVADVDFWGDDIQLPASERNDIAASVVKLTHGDSVQGVMDEAIERIREGWLDQGFFQVHVTAEATILDSSKVSKTIRLSARVEEGYQYTLREITFGRNTIFYARTLRSLFPIKDGEIFHRQKLVTGLEKLKIAYADRGFINFTAVPNPNVEESTRSIALNIDIDEGKQFFVRNVNVFGVDEPEREEVLANFLLKRGQVYNQQALKWSLEKQELKLPECPCQAGELLHMDEKDGIVDITLDFRPCS